MLENENFVENKYIYHDGCKYKLTAHNHLLIGKKIIWEAFENNPHNSNNQHILLDKAKTLIEIAVILGNFEAVECLIKFYYSTDESTKALWSHISNSVAQLDYNPDGESVSKVVPYVNHIKRNHNSFNIHEELSEFKIHETVFNFLNIDDNIDSLNISGNIATYNYENFQD